MCHSENDSMNTFKIGDMVSLNSGHQDMIVNWINDVEGCCECIWFKDDASIMTSDFPQEVLELTEEREKRYLKLHPGSNLLRVGPYDVFPDEAFYSEDVRNIPADSDPTRNPYYDNNADMDQQSQEFWDWF